MIDIKHHTQLAPSPRPKPLRAAFRAEGLLSVTIEGADIQVDVGELMGLMI